MKNRIRELREAQGINQSEFAQILGVRQNTLSTWETGRYEPDGEMLKKIAAALNVSVDYLLGGDPPWTTYTGDQFNYLDIIKIMRTLEQLTAAQFERVLDFAQGLMLGDVPAGSPQDLPTADAELLRAFHAAPEHLQKAARTMLGLDEQAGKTKEKSEAS